MLKYHKTPKRLQVSFKDLLLKNEGDFMRTLLGGGNIIFIYLVAILIFINIVSVTPIAWANQNDIQAKTFGSNSNPQSGDIRSTKIDGYLQLFDLYSYEPHDGIFGDDDGFKFYLGAIYYNFRITLYNMGNYMKDIFTYLRATPESVDVITVLQPYWNLSYLYNYDYDNFYYDLRISNNTKLTTYELALDIVFSVYDPNMGDYVINSGTIHFKLKLSPRIKTTNGEDNLKLSALDKNGNVIPLYSGTTNQLLGLSRIYSESDTLDDVEFLLKLPSTLNLESKTVKIEKITTNYYNNKIPTWRLIDAGPVDIKAQKISGLCSISYILNNQKITESDLQVIVEIVETPILGLETQIPESEIGTIYYGKLKANLEIYQGTISNTFSLTFSNIGNIDLRNVEVELYTDNAEYFYNPNFYYDENNHAIKQPVDDTIELGDIKTGKSVTKEFTLRVIENLPPGLYKIPIKYTASYNTSNYINIDLTEENFHKDIIASRSPNKKGYTPFILVLVNEGDDENDKSEPDIIATSSTQLRQGMQNVQLTIELINLESYQLNNANAFINAGEPSPLQSLNDPDRSVKILRALEQNFTIYGADSSGYSNKFTVHFLVDVYKDTLPGRHDVPISVVCYDAYNRQRISIINVALMIDPIEPNLIISDILTTEIEPNSNFTLEIKIYNYGGSEAKNVRLMFNGTSNLFSAKESISEPQNINKSEEVKFEFDILAYNIKQGNSYIAYILISYEDITGKFYYFDDNPSQSILLQTKKGIVDEEAVDLTPKFILTYVSTTNITPNSNFNLKIKIYNCGGTYAYDAYLIFNGSSNLFSANQSICGPQFIDKNKEIVFKYEIFAGNVKPGTIYSTIFIINYRYKIGEVSYYDEKEFIVNLKVKDIEEVSDNKSQENIYEKEKIEEIKSEDSNKGEIEQGLALIILGMFILVSTIIFSFIHFKVSRVSRIEKPKLIKEPQNSTQTTQIQTVTPTIIPKQTATPTLSPPQHQHPQLKPTVSNQPIQVAKQQTHITTNNKTNG